MAKNYVSEGVYRVLGGYVKTNKNDKEFGGLFLLTGNYDKIHMPISKKVFDTVRGLKEEGDYVLSILNIEDEEKSSEFQKVYSPIVISIEPYQVQQ